MQKRHLKQSDLKFQWNVFICRICLKEVPIASVQHFILFIPDFRHMNLHWFPEFSIIILDFHGKSFGV